jgi:cobyrinic acid a,c-diamide synthase
VGVIPRVVIAGTSSGAGKTTVACGLIGALRARGLEVQGFKVGPDYIDPSHHALASGRPGRNLDAFLSGPELIAPLARHGADGADVAVIEGVMGMFDGASGRGELASTAHVAKLLQAPVLLVLDASAMARSAAAIVHGYTTFDPDVDVAGVIFNRVGSDHHEQLLREALEPLGIPVVGVLRRDERIATPERHLGLVPAGEREASARAALATLAEAMSRCVDLDRIERIARGAPELVGAGWSGLSDGARAAGACAWRSPRARLSRFTTRRTWSCCALLARSWCRSIRCVTKRCRRTWMRCCWRGASRRCMARSSRRTRACARRWQHSRRRDARC